MEAHAVPTRGLSANRDVVRIAAERRDVIAHPQKRRALIEQTVVARGGIPGNLGGQRRMREETERSVAIVRRDDDGPGPLDQFLRIAVGDARGRCLERAGVNPHDHRHWTDRDRIGCPDVDPEAILGTRRGRARGRGHLRTRSCGGGRGQRRWRPGRGWLRRLPSQVADRRRRERNTEKAARPSQIHSLHRALERRDKTGRCLRRRLLRGQEAGGEDGDEHGDSEASSHTASNVEAAR